MFSLLFLTLSICLSSTSAQFPNSYQSGTFPSSPSSGQWQRPSGPASGQYQPYRAPTLSSGPTFQSGQYQGSPQLSTLNQLSRYSGLSSAIPQSSPWSQYQPSGNRGWSVPSPVSSYPGLAQPSSTGLTGYSGYSRPTPLAAPSLSPPAQSWSPSVSQWRQPTPQTYSAPSLFQSPPAQTWRPAPAQTYSAPQPAQVQGTPFQSSWSIQHQAPQPVAQSAAPQAPAYASPVAAPPAQTWAQPSVSQWRPPTPQTYSAPAPLPSPPAQTWSAPQPAPVAAAPQQAPVSSYQSPQNAQNLRPAPVHYASIGQQLQGDYKFGYHTGDGGSFREETRLPDGTVQGAYGFIDADGKQRIVKYRAGKDGFQAEGDDVPKGTPAISGDGASATASAQPAASPINIDDGAAFKSFTQG